MLSPRARELLEIQRRKYLDSLPAKQNRIAECWRDLLDTEWADGPCDCLKTEIHRLAGSAGSYGFDELGEVARQLDRMFAAEHSTEAQRILISTSMARLSGMFDEAVRDSR